MTMNNAGNSTKTSAKTLSQTVQEAMKIGKAMPTACNAIAAHAKEVQL
ncbi:hypothetical protein [Bifidobacterium subtile]|jgi:hypothetical protein